MQANNFDTDYTQSPHWQQQVKLAQLSRQTNAPHTYARSAAVASRSGNLAPLTVTELAMQLADQSPSSLAKSTPSTNSTSKITPATNARPMANGTMNPQQKNAKLEEERQRRINEQVNKQFWTALDLGGQGLCRLSNRLFGYNFLQKLYLNHNKLMVLPSTISQLSQLKVLDLSDNLLTELPPELGVMFNLRFLFCFDNRIQTLPFEFGSLFQLEVLGLEGNPLNEHMRDLLAKEGTRGLIVELREKAPVTVESHPREWLLFDSPDSTSTLDSADADTISVLSYNTLCDHYATPQLYGYTPSWALGWKYRSDLLSAEVMALDTDVVSLQEVDRNSFDDFWMPQLKAKGYDGFHSPKTRAKTMDEVDARKVDGCATFWRKSKLRLVQRYGMEYNTLALKRDDFKKTADIYNRVMNKDNIAVVFVFERVNAPPDQQLFVLANTHLHWNPAFEDVKLVQVGLLLEELERILDKYASNSTPEGSKFPRYTDPKLIPMAVCGDYNSTADSGVYQLFSQNKVPADHADLKGKVYGKYTEDGLKHSLQIKSSYEEIGELPFTNYTPNFVKAIDYIWYTTPTINVAALLGPIDEEYTKHFVGFPNAHHPSDHIPIATKFTFKKIKEPATKPPPPTFSRKT